MERAAGVRGVPMPAVVYSTKGDQMSKSQPTYHHGTWIGAPASEVWPCLALGGVTLIGCVIFAIVLVFFHG
jgi:hypothetical protein